MPVEMIGWIAPQVSLRGALQVYGNDYPTRDGTAIRDYIHVVDLANAHIAAMERLLGEKGQVGMEVFNLGTGTGSTVLEVITAFERATNAKLDWEYADRRAGDIMAAFADTSLATRELGWTADKTLDESMADSWRWQQSLEP
jgi:UDP-glucose 4-epimerase